MLNFLLESTGNGTANPASGGFTMIFMLILLIGMWFFMSRSNKKKEKEAADMRDNLQVGDEVTTIGGIIGRVVSIKDETFTLETSRDRTKIRFVRNAIRSVDVRIADKYAEAAAAEAKTEEAPAEEVNPAEADKKASKKGKKDAE